MHSWFDAFVPRADRFIAAGRVVLGFAALVAIWLDPAQPAQHQTLTYVLLAAYALYTVVQAFLAWRRATSAVGGELAAHVGDLAVFTVLMYLTEGPSSPFFIFLSFALLAATLRWQWQGALWTAAACLAILAGLGVAAAALPDMEVELHRLIIRGIYIAVAAFMLACLGAHQAYVRAELWRLAESPPTPAVTPDPPIAEALGYAAGILQVPRALLVWAEPEEPWVRLSVWEGGSLHEERAPPGRYASWVAEPLQGAAFFSPDAARPEGTVVHLGSGRFEPRPVLPIPSELAAPLGIASVVSVPLPTSHVDARLFLLDRPGFTADSLLVAEVAAARVAATFEQWRLLGELHSAAAAAERVRIARDLHDGVLQSLAGTALQLRALQLLLGKDPEEARSRLAKLQDALAGEQRELRTFIQALEPGVEPMPAGAGEETGSAAQLRRLATRLERQWELVLRWRLVPDDARIEAPLASDLWRIISEAVANAARHGAARTVEVEVSVAPEALALSVVDDGRGFPFTGQLDQAALAARGLAPRSLWGRVAARGGSLVIDSGPAGARLEISLPLASTTAPRRSGRFARHRRTGGDAESTRWDLKGTRTEPR